MHRYWLQTITQDRIETLRSEADRRRLVASAARVPRDPLSARLQRRIASLVPLIAPLDRRPQPCTC